MSDPAGSQYNLDVAAKESSLLEVAQVVRKQMWTSALAALLFWTAGMEFAWGDEVPVGKSPSPTSRQGLPGQEFEDSIEPLTPARSRTAAEQARVDALSWFGAGRVMQARGELQGAYRAYRKAIERDPAALAVYRQAIPLALHLNQVEDAVGWVKKAVELAPEDYQWLVQLAELQIRSEDLNGAIDSLEHATSLPSMDHKSTPYIVLKHQLGQWYLATQRTIDAARVLEPVFAAVVHPEEYKLPPQVRNQITSGLNFEKFGEVFLEGDKPDLALEALAKAVEKRGSPTGDVSYQMARAQLKKNNYDQALAELQKYIDGQRQSRRQAAYDLLADILRGQGRIEELIPRLEQAAEKDARNPFLQLFLADQYAAANRLDQAEVLFKKTLAASADARGFAGLAAVYRRQNRPAELLLALGNAYGESGSLKLLEPEFKAIVSDKELLDSVIRAGNELRQKELNKFKYPVGYVMAHLAAEAKLTDEAVAVFRQLMTIRNDRTTTLYEELGSMLMESKRYGQAAEVYREAATAVGFGGGGERTQFLYMRTLSLALDGQANEALAQLRELQSKANDNPLFAFREAWIYAHSRQFDEAIPRFERLLKSHSGNRALVRMVQSALSNTYVSKGDIRRGEEILEAIFRESPGDISINNDLGYLYADQGKNLEQAEQMIRKALDSEPENSAYLDSMGWILFRRDKPEEALPYILKSVEKGQGLGDETIWDHLGDVYERLGRRAEAVDAWQKALNFARQAAYPDPQLIEKIDQKLRGRLENNEKLKSPSPDSL